MRHLSEHDAWKMSVTRQRLFNPPPKAEAIRPCVCHAICYQSILPDAEINGNDGDRQKNSHSKKMTSRRKSLQDVIDFIYRTFLKNKNKIMIQWKFRDFTTLFSCKKLTLHIIGIQCSKKEVKKQTVKWMRRKKRTACSTRLHFINPSKNLPRWNTRHINKPRKRSIP